MALRLKITPTRFLTLLLAILLLSVSSSRALTPSPPLAPDKTKKNLTEKDIRSPEFLLLQRITGLDNLGLRLLYETSGAREFKKFAEAILVAQALHLDRQLVLRALHERSLDDILSDLRVPEKQRKEAKKLTKKQFDQAREAWKKAKEAAGF